MKKTRFVLGCVLSAVVMAACGVGEEPADLVLLGGRIVTMDSERPGAAALAARGQRIVAVGDEQAIRRLIGAETEVIELDGAAAFPGLIEGHGHFLSLGRARMQLDLVGAASWAEIVEMVGEAADRAAAGQWILGRGWHQEKWLRAPEVLVDGFPVHDALTAAAPLNPVLLTHASGHAAVVNVAAMELAGIDGSTPDPAGGEIVRDPEGRATGVLLDTASEAVEELTSPDLNEPTARRMVELAGAECLAKGVTSFQDAGTNLHQLALLEGMAEAGRLPVRLWVMLSDDNPTLAERLPKLRLGSGSGGGFLTVGGIKRWVDGALGSHSAWLLEPYSDQPARSGLNIVSPDELRDTARLAVEHRLQLCTHAIGDRANRETLDVYEELLSAMPDGGDRRWRVEHAQHLHPEDLPRFAALGVVAAMQPVHCSSDGPWVAKRLGEERARSGAYMWRSLLDSGAVIVGGTDTPVEDVDPIANFHAAVTRQMPDGSAFFPEQRMTRLEALRALTIDAAWAAFEERDKGSLELGKLADLTVLSQDILSVAEERIPDTRVLYTIVGGEVRYRGR